MLAAHSTGSRGNHEPKKLATIRHDEFVISPDKAQILHSKGDQLQKNSSHSAGIMVTANSSRHNFCTVAKFPSSSGQFLPTRAVRSTRRAVVGQPCRCSDSPVPFLHRGSSGMVHNTSSMDLSRAERSVSNILVVEPDPSDRNLIRTMLKNLGYGNVSDSPHHLASLDKFDGRTFSHLIFDARKGTYPLKDWFAQILEIAPHIVAIPCSYNPSVDEVFELLIAGAKGFLVKPFTLDSLDRSVILATKGEPIPDAVKQARDRNEALVALMMTNLDRLATAHRQARQFETAIREVERAEAALRRASDLALLFAKGGEDGLIDAIQRFCIATSRGPATRLGRLRKRLASSRVVDPSNL